MSGLREEVWATELRDRKMDQRNRRGGASQRTSGGAGTSA